MNDLKKNRPSLTSCDHDETRALLVLAGNLGALEFFDWLTARADALAATLEAVRTFEPDWPDAPTHEEDEAAYRVMKKLRAILDATDTARILAERDEALERAAEKPAWAEGYRSGYAAAELEVVRGWCVSCACNVCERARNKDRGER